MQHTEVRHLRVADRALVAGAIVAPVGTPLGQVIRSQRCRVLPVQAVDDSPMRLSVGAASVQLCSSPLRCVFHAQTGQVTAVQVSVDVRDGAGAMHYGVPSTRLARVRQQSAS